MLHFSKKELACKCGCGQLPTAENLLAMVAFLEWIRGLTRGKIRVHSAFRCQKHNAKVGGALSSRHMICAVDISSPLYPPKDLYSLIDSDPKASKGGLGLYSGWVHWDNWKRRRWQK